MRDYLEVSRTEWLDLARQLGDRIEHHCREFTPVEWERVTPYLGWRVRDVIAHLNSAMPVNFRPMLDRALADNPHAPPEFDTFARNGRAVAQRREWPIADLLQEFRTETDSLLAVYRDLSDADWLKPAWFYLGPVTVRTLFLAQLGDTLFHERDILLVNGKWRGFAPDNAPLVDWFMRELRPASFRPERSNGLRATVVYRIRGVGAGAWTMTISGTTCSVVLGATTHPDVVVEADMEDLILAVQGRASPRVGSLARLVARSIGPVHAEDLVAMMTGQASLASALLRRRIRTTGNLAAAYRFNGCFWHFWQRSAQAKANIARE
jgi:uncharacterized protein (TIGR03083 family)